MQLKDWQMVANLQIMVDKYHRGAVNVECAAAPCPITLLSCVCFGGSAQKCSHKSELIPAHRKTVPYLESGSRTSCCQTSLLWKFFQFLSRLLELCLLHETSIKCKKLSSVSRKKTNVQDPMRSVWRYSKCAVELQICNQYQSLEVSVTETGQ